LKPYVQQGRIVWATNTEKVTAWKAQYKSQPHLYPFAQNIVSGISSEKIAEGRLGLAIAPNPADDQAVAYFILTRPERVSLRLYNVLGQEVALLLDAELEAGEHAIQLPLGHYPSSFVFVRISSASFSITKSVQVLR
jgi:hypothetical protein